jgi:hypothetical protein
MIVVVVLVMVRLDGAWGQRAMVNARGTVRVAGARQARSLQA